MKSQHFNHAAQSKKIVRQGLGEFDCKINVTPNELEKFMSFNINIMLVFIDIFQFLSFSLDSLLKNLVKDDFKDLSKEFIGDLIELSKQKMFFLYEYISGWKNIWRGIAW